MSAMESPEAVMPATEPVRNHIFLENVSWSTYEALLADLGDHRRSRIFYDRGSIEIMSPSSIHEALKRLIGRLIETFTYELGIKILSVGSTTWKSNRRKRGAEADESYYIENEPLVRHGGNLNPDKDPPPDLAVETDITTSVLDRLEIYASLGVREIWRHDGKALTIYQLQPDGQYKLAAESAMLPMLPIADLVRFLDQRGSLDETTLVRSFGKWVRTHFDVKDGS